MVLDGLRFLEFFGKYMDISGNWARTVRLNTKSDALHTVRLQFARLSVRLKLTISVCKLVMDHSMLAPVGCCSILLTMATFSRSFQTRGRCGLPGWGQYRAKACTLALGRLQHRAGPKILGGLRQKARVQIRTSHPSPSADAAADEFSTWSGEGVMGR